MKLRSPWLIRPLALLAAGLIRAWMATVRKRFFALDGREHPADVYRQRYLYAFWHEDVLVLTSIPAKIRVLISQHADGELIARTAHHLGKGAVRGSTTRGGHQALLELLAAGRRSHLGVTPDGPRGPRRRVQMGLVFLAAQAGLPVVAVGVGYTRAWRARSWDRFAVPLPGGAAVCVFTEPIRVPAKLSRPQLEAYRRLV